MEARPGVHKSDRNSIKNELFRRVAARETKELNFRPYMQRIFNRKTGRKLPKEILLIGDIN